MIFSQKTESGNPQKGCLIGWIVLLCISPFQFLYGLESLTKNPSCEEINQAFGCPLFRQEILWRETDQSVASRLGLREESRTSVESGYRLYPETGASILGVRPFSIFLQGIRGQVARLSIVFANKGDVSVYASDLDRRVAMETKNRETMVTPQMRQAYQAAIRHDGAQIRAALTALLGPSVPATLGKGGGMDERGDRWDWNGCAFILFSPRNEYVALRILPAVTVDNSNAERNSILATKALIPGRVIQRASGDVVISDLPMVDQRAKGYCVPATYERVLRYYGLSADMNLLAMAGNTDAGGGTSMAKIATAAYGLVREAGGKITSGIPGVKINDVAPYIDKGEPVLWALYSSDELNDQLEKRRLLRSEVINAKSADDWNHRILPPWRISARRLPKQEGHVCLIIGYNRNTREIAISDSWGPAFAERWMTEEEAQAVNQGEGTVIGW